MGEYTTFECRECGYTADRIRWGVSVNDPRNASCRATVWSAARSSRST